MARHNNVFLLGMVYDDPIIARDKETGEYKKGMFSLAVLRNARDVGDNERDVLRYDLPIIFSANPENIAKIAELKKNDIVEIKGFFTTIDIKKNRICKNCGNTDYDLGTFAVISPAFIDRRETDLTEREALVKLKERIEVSNQVIAIGNLCTDVNYYYDDNAKIKNAKFQMAINRKFYLHDKNPSIRTDYPYVSTFGKNASEVRDCLHTGSMILIDGRIQTREYPRTAVCSNPECQFHYEWSDKTMEIVPYSIEYLQDFLSQAEIEANKEKRVNDIQNELFGSNDE